MEPRRYGMGLYGWEDGSMAVVGGMRADGYHAPGRMRTRFGIYDLGKPGPAGPAQVGELILDMRLAEDDGSFPEIHSIISIEIARPLRRNGEGWGARTVRALSGIAESDIPVHDIKAKAVGFWRKVGCRDVAARFGRTDAVLDRELVLELSGVEPSAPRI